MFQTTNQAMLDNQSFASRPMFSLWQLWSSETELLTLPQARDVEQPGRESTVGARRRSSIWDGIPSTVVGGRPTPYANHGAENFTNIETP